MMAELGRQEGTSSQILTLSVSGGVSSQSISDSLERVKMDEEKNAFT